MTRISGRLDTKVAHDRGERESPPLVLYASGEKPCVTPKGIAESRELPFRLPVTKVQFYSWELYRAPSTSGRIGFRKVAGCTGWSFEK